jgi:uncharacterized Ntn-hydrolase superfamily protein
MTPLCSSQAGRDAGGQATPDGTAITERSASLRVLGGGEDSGMHIMDFRVDMHHSAVHGLRRIFEVNKVYGVYSEKRDLDPSHAPSMMAYEAEALPRGGVFASRQSCYRLPPWSAVAKHCARQHKEADYASLIRP